ncbi:MAG: endonuclease/exonuclease/phosphatase family protein [Cetobacterium sp.]
MKKYIFLFLMLINILLYGEFEANIAVYNTLRLGRGKKDYVQMAKGIEKFQLIGLVEVMSKKGIENLVDALEKVSGEKWDYHLAPYAVGTGKYREYYGYVYKRKDVKFIKSNGYFPDEKEWFIREPYGSTFKINNFDFTLVLVHSIFGKSQSQRRAEAFKLDEVYDYFQNQDKKEKDIIIAGDFNLPANDEAFEQLIGHKDKIMYAIDPGIKTTIGKKGFSSSYDNFFLSAIHTKEFTGKSGAIDTTFGEYSETRKNISDHIPIFINVLTGEDDD